MVIMLSIFQIQSHEVYIKQLYEIGFYIMPCIDNFTQCLIFILFLIHIHVER